MSNTHHHTPAASSPPMFGNTDFFDDTPEDGPVNPDVSMAGYNDHITQSEILHSDEEGVDDFPEDVLGEPRSEIWY